MRDINYWIKLTQCATRGLTAEQVRAVANHAYEWEQSGKPRPSVWHSSAQVLGHKCNCAMCNPNR